MTNSEKPAEQSQHYSAETESPRLNQEQQQLDEASFQATFSALVKLLKIKQKKYHKSYELALLEGKISLQAIAVLIVLILLTLIVVTVLWCLINVAIVTGAVQLGASLWLGIMIVIGINTLLITIFFMLINKVKRQVGFNRSKRILKGDL